MRQPRSRRRSPICRTTRASAAIGSSCSSPVVTTRASTSDLYPELGTIRGLDSATTDDANPTIAESALALYFTSECSQARHVYVAKCRSLTTAFAAPILEPGLESEVLDSFDVTPDGLALYISHTNVDLLVARRTSTSLPFDPPVTVNAEFGAPRSRDSRYRTASPPRVWRAGSASRGTRGSC